MRAAGTRSKSRSVYARRRFVALGVALAAVSVVVVAVAAGLTRLGGRVVLRSKPTPVQITAYPDDATITLGRFPPAAGRLTLVNAKPGVYRLAVRRRGFRGHAERVRFLQGRRFARKVALEPLLFNVSVRTRPEGAHLRVSTASGPAVTARTPFGRKLAAGPMQLAVRAPGHNRIIEKLFLDSPRRFTIWLDPKGLLHHCLSVFGCGPSPKQVAFSPDGKSLWVSTMGATGVEVYNWRTGRLVGRVDMGPNGAVEVLFSKSGSTVYASQMQTASVYEIDARSLKLGRRYPTKSSWTKVMALSPDEKRLYAANWSGNNVTEIDLAKRKVRRQIPTAATPRGLHVTADGRRLFVAGFERGEIERIDLRTGKGKTLLRTGGAIRHFAANDKKGLLYADDMAKDRVFVVNMKTGKVRTLCGTDHKPNTIDLTPDGRVLYVSNRGANSSTSYYVPGPEWGSVLAVDAKTGKPLDAIVGGNQCTGLDVSHDGRYLAFSDFLDSRIHVYSIPPYRTLATGRGGRYKAHFTDIKK